MPKLKDTTDDMPVTYTIEIPQQKSFNTSNGQWELRPLYSTPPWVKYHEKMTVQDGRAMTTDPEIALELVDSGAQVSPDPRPFLQEKYAKEMELEASGNPMALADLAGYVKSANQWRMTHNLPPLSVAIPDVPRPISALLMPLQSMG